MSIEEFRMIKLPNDIFAIKPYDEGKVFTENFILSIRKCHKKILEIYIKETKSLPMEVKIDFWSAFFNSGDYLIYAPSLDSFFKVKSNVIEANYIT